VNPQTGTTLARVNAASSSGLYGVREGAVLGIDHGGLGKAWADGIAAQRVVWTSRPLPWPHYFVDLSGIGGSAPPGQGAVLLAVCGQVGPRPAGNTTPRASGRSRPWSTADPGPQGPAPAPEPRARGTRGQRHSYLSQMREGRTPEAGRGMFAGRGGLPLRGG
jgi:hypothetical protein